MKKEQKLILIVFGAIILLFFAYWIILGNKTNLSVNGLEASNTQSGGGQTSSNIPTNFQWSSSTPSGVGSSSTTTGVPLTEQVASNLSNEFILNWNGSTSTDSINALANNLDLSNLKNELSGQRGDMSVDVSNEIIKTTSNNSKESQLAYGNAYLSAVVTVGHYLSNTDTLDSILYLQIVGQDSSRLDSLITDNQKVIKNLRSLTVPTIFVNFQKSNLALFLRLDKDLNYIKNINSDPVQAQLALDDFVNIIKQWINIRSQIVLSN